MCVACNANIVHEYEWIFDNFKVEGTTQLSGTITGHGLITDTCGIMTS